MEEHERAQQYRYGANANLVLNLAERRKGDLGPASEVTSLAAKNTPDQLQKKFGDRATHNAPPEFEKKREEQRKRREREMDEDVPAKKARRPVRGASVLNADVTQEYTPQTKESRVAYDILLRYIQDELPDKPHDVLRGAAYEVLLILKDESLKDMDKKREVERLFRRNKPMEDDRFSSIYNTSRRITDFRAEEEAPKGDIDEELGVNVVFDKEDQDGNADDMGYEVREEDDGSDVDDGDVEMHDASTEQIVSKMSEADGAEHELKEELEARSIDAFWLQREIAKYYKDAVTAQKVAQDVFNKLTAAQVDDRAYENSLVDLLGFDKFELIKLLLRNRLKIVFCTRLARAGADEQQRAEIENEMMSVPAGRQILSSLKRGGADRTVDLEKKLHSEARQLAKRVDMDIDEGGIETISSSKVKSADAGAAATPDVGDPFWLKRPKTVLDIESMKLERGAHTMSTDKLRLPENSTILQKKGYKEVHIPPYKPKPFGETERLVQINELPEWMRGAFENAKGERMKELNRIQSKVYETALFSAENMLLCAPTGAGKTNVAMLTILRELGLNRSNDDGKLDLEAFKIVYIAPMKSLVQELVLNLGGRLKKFGIQVKELSGDQQLSKEQIQSTQIIVTTPEKWDIITRKSGDRTYTQLVRLVIIDEIHLLHDTRGPVLESIVARTIRHIESTQEHIRLVGLSATLPNYEDVADFLRVRTDKGLFFFDNSFRPVPLQQQFIGITAKKAFKRMELTNQICNEKVLEYAGTEQVLVFVHSRKETATTARSIRDFAAEQDALSKFVGDDTARRLMLTEMAESKVKSEALKELLPYGFAIHNAGMTRSDRTLVEDLFAGGHIQVLVSTSTLAWGVNLPAHVVIIKGTQIYSPEKGDWVELSPMDVMQMLGRAGRPQYDEMGVGIVITSAKEMSYYMSLQTQQLPVESQFITSLVDNLNAEVVLGSVANVREAVSWLGYSYLYVRMLRNPKLYGLAVDESTRDPALEQRRFDLIHTAASMLDKHGLMKYDRRMGGFQVTDLGRVASHYYLSYSSVAAFNEYLKPTISDIELLRVFSMAGEFKYMTVREEEKLELAKLLDKVPIPVKENMEEPSAKVNVLLQTFISRLKLEGFALVADMVYITQSAGRIMRALFEICLKRGWASAAERALTFCKSIDHRMWAAQSPLRQFSNVPAEVVKRLEQKEFAWERLYDLDEPALGDLVRIPKMGRVLHRAIHQLPKLVLTGQVQPITRSMLRVELTVQPDFQWDDKVHGFAEPFWIWVEDVDGETILHHELFILKKQYAAEEHYLSFTIPIHDPMPPQYFVRVCSDRWLGSETVLPISFRHLILPEKQLPPTELLDLQALPITELANEKFISLYANQFDHFNPIQTQVFNTLYKTDTNTFVGAFAGSGKTVCAELAVFRALSQRKATGGARIVYIAPLPALAKERFNDWQKRFGQKLGYKVVMLTGDSTADLKLLAEGTIIIATPEQWDVMSRRWTTRKNVQNVHLFIVDELHLINGSSGPVLEVILSRMRFIAQQTGNPIRIVALATSVANAKDLADWIGAPPNSWFNFHPAVRPLPLEIRVQGFDINSHTARQLAMSKPCYVHIKRLSPEKPVLVFVPSRKQARTVAIDLMTAAVYEQTPKRFLHASAEDLKPFLAKVKNTMLQKTLEVGIGFYHEGLSDKERQVVETLFHAGAIQVVVAEQSLCWGMSMSAHMVVIMGTEYFEGKEHRYVDVPVADVVQMLGRACRPTLDKKSVAFLFCHSPKREFYKKFLSEPFPVESHLDQALADHLNAEIVTKRLENVQDAVDYLTWTFYYRRITQNPNYYHLAGVTHRHLSDHLSELVENTLADLQNAGCITIEDETDLAALNLGMVAAYYYLRYTTVELFSNSLTAKIKLKGLLEVLSHAAEFETVPVRHKEDMALKKLAHHCKVAVDAQSFNDPHVKTNILLQSHFSRVPLAAAAAADQRKILPDAIRLLQACVDVVSSKSWLKPALMCMEMSQMVTQGIWNTDSPLLQLPHVTKETAKALADKGVETVFAFMEMEDKDRDQMLKLPPAKLQEVAQACNAYPNIDMSFEVADADSITAGSSVTVKVTLQRDVDEEEDGDSKGAGGAVPTVYAPRYPVAKNEGWWLVVGDPDKNELVCIKRVALKGASQEVELEFNAPAASGPLSYKLSLMSDSYLGADQEYDLDLKVGDAAPMDQDGDDDGAQGNGDVEMTDAQ